MPQTPAVLGQASPTAAAGAVPLVTVASGNQAVAAKVLACNTTTGAITVRAFVRPAGAAVATATAAVYDVSIPANSTVAILENVALGSTDVLSVQTMTGAGTPITYTATGLLVTP
jgi:hypothetical protein